MPPGPLLAVVAQRELRPALRARPPRPRGVLDGHLDPLGGHRELYGGDPPRLLDPQQLTVQLHVPHRAPPRPLTDRANGTASAGVLPDSRRRLPPPPYLPSSATGSGCQPWEPAADPKRLTTEAGRATHAHGAGKDPRKPGRASLSSVPSLA